MTDTFQWLRCDSAGANCVPIVGATNAARPSYTADDVGHRLRLDGWRDGVYIGRSAPTSIIQPIGGGGEPEGAWEYVDFEEPSFPPPGWNISTFFGRGASCSRVADPLGERGQVLKLSCPQGSYPTTYTADALQQAAFSVDDKSQAHAGNGDESWEAFSFMFLSGNKFANGFTNFMEENHVEETGPYSPGMFAFGGYPLTAGGTTTPKLIYVRRSGTIAHPVETFYPGGTSTVEAASGLTPAPDQWHDVVFHHKRETGVTGLFEWWFDGDLIVSAPGPTFYSDPGEVLGFAVYNYRYHVLGNSDIYYDRIIIGETADSIGFTP